MSKSHTHSIRSSRSLSDFGITPHNNILKTKTAKVKKFLLDLATTTGKVDLNGLKQALAHNGIILTNQQEFLELAQTIKQRIKVEVIMEWIKFGKPTGNKDQISATFEAPRNMTALLSDNLSQSSFNSQNKVPRPPSRSISQPRSIASAVLGRRVSNPVMNLNESIEQADNRSEKSLVLSTKPLRPPSQTGAQRPVSAVLSRRSGQNQDDNISRATVKNFRPVKKLPNEQQKTMGQRAFSNLLDKTFHSTKEPTKPKEERINTQYSSNNRIRTLDRNSTVNSSFSDTSSRDGSFDRKLIDTINDEEDEPRLVPNILVYKPARPLTKGTGSYEELVVELIHDLQKKTVEYEFLFRMLKILMKQTHKYNTKRIFRDVYEVEANALKPVLGPELYTRIIDLCTNKEGKVSLKLMASLVDKYKHAPHYVTEFKNSSHRFQEIALFGSKIQGKVRKVHENCQLLSRRIEEKFKKMGKAYRFFDLDKTGYVTFPSFKHGLDLLGIRLSEEEAKELFTYLDGKKDGILDHDEFCDILEERRLMKKVKANHDLSSTTQSTATDHQMSRSSKDSPFLTFITTNLKAQPKFVDFRKESSSDILSTSYISSAHIKQLKKNPTLRRKFSLVGSATKSNASLPSDTDEKFKYGVKSKATESMKDIMANNYQREWIERAQEKEQRRIDAEKERRSCPKRWTTDASMLRGAFVSSMIARKKQGDSMWKMTRFSNVKPKVNSHAMGSRRGSAGNNATMLDYSMSQGSFHLENPRDLNISVL